MTAASRHPDEMRHTIRSVSLGTGLRLLRWPFVILSVIFIPRVMQEAVYGRFAFFISVYFLADALTDVGTLQVFGRFIPGPSTPEQEDRRGALVQGLLVIGIMLSLLAGLLVALFVLLFSVESFPISWILPFCILLVVTRIEGVLFGLMYGLNHIARYSSRDVLRSLLLLGGVLFFFSRYGLAGAIWSLVVKEMILVLIALRWTRHHVFRRCHLPWVELQRYFVFGCMFYVPLLLFGLLQRSGAVFVQVITQSPEAVGYYDIANQFFLMSVSFLGVILVTLLPSMSAYREANDDAIIHRWHRNIMGYCGVMVFFVFNALVWFGDPVLALSLGPGFVPVRDLALIMVLAMVPGLIVYVGMNYAILDKEPLIYARGVFAGIVVMTLTCLVLIPYMKAAGAAWGTVAGHAVLALFFWWRYRAAFRLALDGFFKALLIGVLFIPILWIHVEFPWNGVLFMATSVVYIALVLFAGILDLALLRQYMKKGWEFFCRGCRD